MRVSRRSTSSKAKAAPGVLLVLTGADAAADKLGAYTAAMMPEDIGGPKGHRIHQQVLQAEKVRFVGDRVAFVVAETEAQARDAADMIEVDYETLPAVALLEDAAKDGAPKVWDDNPNGNVAFVLGFGDEKATDAAFAGAKHVVKLRMENNRITPVSMEPRTSIGDYNAADDHYTLYTSSQNPHGVRAEMSGLLKTPENQIRVVAPDVGGGFGLKGGSFPDDVLTLWASKKLRRPVKWVATRSESMMNDHTGRDLVSYGELALDENGKILAIRSQSLFQIGAYFVGPGMFTGLFSLRFIPEAYDVQTMHIVCKGLFTNTPQAGPYRGAGRPEAAYFTERMIEHAAKQIGMDVAEIRRRNLIAPDKFPYETPTHYVYDSGEFVRLLDKCVEMVDWKGYEKRRKASEKERQAARPLGLLLHRVRRHLQRPHGHPLRSGRQRHGVRRHAFARAGARDRVRAARARIPRRAVREHPLRAGRHRAGAVRPRHLWRAQRGGRRQLAQGRGGRDHREGEADGRRHDGSGRGRHRVQGRHAARWRAPTRRSRSPRWPRRPMRRWGR